MKKIIWIVFVGIACIIGLYPFLYFFIERNFGLLSTKSKDILGSVFWNIGFYLHIILGGIALLVGWSQFSKTIRNKYLNLHKAIGKIYIIAVVISASSGIGIAFYATGGWIASLGFMSLGIIWLSTTIIAYRSIIQHNISKHQEMMIYSYAACFAAVTLRIWLPTLIMLTQNFITAYLIVAWLCWIPNLLVAYFIIGKGRSRKEPVLKT